MSGAFAAWASEGRKTTEFSSFPPLPQLHMQNTQDIWWRSAMILVSSTKQCAQT